VETRESDYEVAAGEKETKNRKNYDSQKKVQKRVICFLA
jgi:hypothetical protein